ncbi:MAG: efflux RND transporter permease subunit [Candidatus Omnitrophica bacterium]|nr:efflux RND transporter permease subunit [Candidatus Omnitrophota bacterium]
MSIPKFSINRPVTIFMIFSAIALFGIISLYNLPIELMPTIERGKISIITYVRGGMPSIEIEKRLAKLLEENLSDISHLKHILTVSKEGENTVVLEFEPEANMDYASLEVRERLAKIKDEFPREAERPVIFQFGYGEFPIIAVTLISNRYTPEDLRKLAEDFLKEKFLRIEGVARAEIVGGREEKIMIELDKRKLAAYNLSLQEILDIVGASNINLVGGKINQRGTKYLVRCLGEFKTIEDIRNLAIKVSEEGSLIRLKDIAEVKADFLEPRRLSRLNIHPAVTIYIYKKSLANTLKVCEAVENLAHKLSSELGERIYTIVTLNRAEFVKKAINQLKTSLLIGSILAIGVLFMFLREYLTIVVLSLSIPFSILFVFSMMYLAKLSINTLTLAGLCLGAGMLLDSSIVVLENIFKRRESIGRLNKADIATASEEMSVPIFASTLTTIIVFLPLIFVNKEIQKLYSGIALSITFSLMGSLGVSLSLVPCLSNLILRKKIDTKVVKTDIFEKFTHIYKKSLELVLTFRYVFVFIAAVGVISTLFLFQKLEKEFIGAPEQDKFTIFIEMPTGTRLDVTDQIVKKVESYVEEYRKQKIVKHYNTRIEPWSARIHVELTPIEKRTKRIGKVIEELRKKTEKLSPAFIYYEEPQEVESKEILVELFGYDYEILKDLAIQSAKYINSIEGLTDVKIRMRRGAPELKILLDKQRAQLFGLTTYDVGLTLHGKLRGLIPTRFRPEKEAYINVQREEKREKEKEKGIIPLYSKYAKEIEIIARLKEVYRKKFKDLEQVFFVTPQGRVELNQIAKFDIGLAPSEIWRKDKKRMVQVSANKGKLPLSKVAREIEEVLKNVKFPEGYSWKFGESYKKMIRNQKELRFAFIIALIFVYLVLGSLFENLFQPLIILTSIPLAGIGSITVLYLKKEPVGVGVLIGGIMLAGIVVNNAIILIDTINRLKKKFSLRESIIRASAGRLRPILMTTSTTILPLLPLLIFETEASPLWKPLALTVVPGLLTSTILTLYIVPSLYLTFFRK